MTSERLRLVRRAALLAAFGVVAYLVALTFCFPYDRAREMAVAIAGKNGYDLEVGAAGPSFPFGILFEDIRVRSRSPAAAGAKPLQARFESARVALFPLFWSKGRAFDVSLAGLGGHIDVSAQSQKKGPFHYEIEVRDINMAQLPGAREMFNLPLGGTLTVAARLDSTSGNFADAKGDIAFKCAACVVGDGKTPIKIGGGNPFLAAGLTLPRVRLGELGGRAAIEKGVAKFQGVQAKSPDAELTVEGEIALRDPLAYSTVNAYLRFKLGDALLKASPAIASVLQMAAAPGRRPDGFYGLRLGGTFSAMTSVFSTTSSLTGAGVAAGRLSGRPAIMPVLAPPPVPQLPTPVSGEPPPPPPPPVAAVPPPPPPAPPPPPPPPSPAPAAPPDGAAAPAVSAGPPMRGTPAAGGIVDSARGMLRGLAGAPGTTHSGGAPGTAGASPDAPAAPPPANAAGPNAPPPSAAVPPPAPHSPDTGAVDDPVVQ